MYTFGEKTVFHLADGDSHFHFRFVLTRACITVFSVVPNELMSRLGRTRVSDRINQ